MAGEKERDRRKVMDAQRLAALLQRGAGRALVIDSRTFSEYNAAHVLGSVNVCCSKLLKRRLQQDKVSVTELLQPNGKAKVNLCRKQEVVVYDQGTKDASLLSKDSFVCILLGKLEDSFHQVSLLTDLSLRERPGVLQQPTRCTDELSGMTRAPTCRTPAEHADDARLAQGGGSRSSLQRSGAHEGCARERVPWTKPDSFVFLFSVLCVCERNRAALCPACDRGHDVVPE
ncbi:hypothetical protein AAFF_G00300850 [Aldrovandia affinis]|uniref:Rhodanese domain-containing protein n=1 Tax=Aldrovandia affinis TaxID=143900 RepID=A0AAD7WRA1_9TELE|nr:hypothetical protein AAFF_G00300850 [Aldrovandia affinis]